MVEKQEDLDFSHPSNTAVLRSDHFEHPGNRSGGPEGSPQLEGDDLAGSRFMYVC